MQIGCCVPIEKYDQAVQAKYDYVEFPAWEVANLTEREVQATVQMLKKAEVPCLRLNAYCKGSPAIVGDSFNEEEVRAYAEKLMKNAAALGVKCIGIGAPPARRLPEGYDAKVADSQCETFLKITAHAASAYGIDILLEALQSGVCNYMNETDHALAMVQKLNLENLHLVIDLYHMETQGEDWAALCRYIPWAQHMHVSTVGEGLRRGLYQEEDAAYCDKTFQTIVNSGYNGTVSIEPDAVEVTPSTIRTALKMMRLAYEHAGIA